MLAAMRDSSRPTFEPAGAGMLLVATTTASVGLGALVGWAAGSVGLGILGGAVVGVPAGIVAVYFRYRRRSREDHGARRPASRSGAAAAGCRGRRRDRARAARLPPCRLAVRRL